MTIRPANRGDIPALLDLMREFYAESDYALDSEWATAAFSALLIDDSRGLAWIAFDGLLPVGYVTLTFRFSMEFGGLDGFVDDLFVRRSHRRRGYGAMLLNTVISAGKERNILAIHVETSANNAAGVALYAKHGFEDRSRLLMTKKITHRQEPRLSPPSA